MKSLKLLVAAYVGGVMRHPHEGIVHLEDADAQRLLDNESAIDVSGDFSAKQLKDVTAEQVTAVPIEVQAPASDPAPHQAEVAPQAVDAPTPATGEVPAASQE